MQPTPQPKMTKAEAGSKGGRTTAARYGSNHFSKIGALGAQSFWQKYTMKPAGTRGWLIVRREDGAVIARTDYSF